MASENTATPAFVLTTVERDSEVKQKAADVAVTAWIVKPVNVDSLLRGARMVLASRRASGRTA